jgi:hypothetical protein
MFGIRQIGGSKLKNSWLNYAAKNSLLISANRNLRGSAAAKEELFRYCRSENENNH